MTDGWIKTTIGDQVTLQRGIDITKASQRPGCVPVISSGGVSSFHDSAYAKGPGVVLGRKGVVGSVYYIETDYWPHDTSLWVRDFHGNDPRFVYYFFKNIAPILASMDVGSANPTLNRNHVHPMSVSWPLLEDQRAIAHILGTLDDKIELNRQMNATLDEIARTLFRSWFVDFDPVRAKADGREPDGMDAETAAFFPDRLVDSELGPIPEGWEVAPLLHLCTSISNGGTPSRANRAFWANGTIPWFKTGELTDGPLLDSEEQIAADGLKNSSAKLWEPGTILVALYASPTVGRMGLLTKEAAANQACSGLVVREDVGKLFVFYSILETRDRLQRIAVGAAQQNISKRVLQEHKLIVPPDRLARTFHDLMFPMFELRISLLNENQSLAQLRNTLVPELLSGRVQVPVAEKFAVEML